MPSQLPGSTNGRSFLVAVIDRTRAAQRANAVALRLGNTRMLEGGSVISPGCGFHRATSHTTWGWHAICLCDFSWFFFTLVSLLILHLMFVPLSFMFWRPRQLQQPQPTPHVL